MSTSVTGSSTSSAPIRGRIIEAEVKVSVDPAYPLPLACGLYAIETDDGIWLCAYYGWNRSVFDYLPQKSAEVDESRMGIVFQVKRFVPKEQYQPAVWEEFKKSRLITYDSHGAG